MDKEATLCWKNCGKFGKAKFLIAGEVNLSSKIGWVWYWQIFLLWQREWHRLRFLAE
jgi:hypothetical protein